MLKRSLFYTPLPFVHRWYSSQRRTGEVLSRQAGSASSPQIITLPFKVLNPVKEVLVQNPQASAFRTMKDIPRSTENMDPKSGFIRPSLPCLLHRVSQPTLLLAVENPDDPKEKWNDGVVAYSSAHLEGVASELIVHSSHSTQSEPQTIEEVRRILLENLNNSHENLVQSGSSKIGRVK